MATFKIHHDEKENATVAASIKNSSTLINQVKQSRPTLSILNNVSNQARTIQGGKTAFGDNKLSGSNHQQQNVFKQQQKTTFTGIIGNNENNGLRVIQQQNKTTVTNTVKQQQQHSNYGSTTNSSNIISIDQSKNFTVYEDKSFNQVTEKNGGKYLLQFQEDFNESANISAGAIRDPLTELTTVKHDLGSETPMSVTDILTSPMSIDKTSISQIDCCDDSVAAVVDDSIAEEKRKLLKKPKNDRERFFEVEEYQEDILAYFREVEKRSRPKPNYMKRQPDINYSMRTILVDWLVEVSEEYKLNTETLFLAISYIDRFLSCMSVVRAKLQLLGTAAMFIAAKYEEIYPPDVSEFVFITDDTYSKTQVLRMEQILLRVLDFDLCGPTCFVYLNTYSVLYSMTDKVKLFATYLSELALLEGDPYLKYLPSQISSGSVALARYILDLPMWDMELNNITTYELMDLKEVIVNLSRSHSAAKTLQQQAIQEKYKQPKYMEVAKIEPVDINASNIEDILIEQLELIEQEESNKSFEEKTQENSYSTNSNNENVRKMISSLNF